MKQSVGIWAVVGLCVIIEKTHAVNLADKLSKASISDLVVDNLRQSIIQLPGHHSKEQSGPNDRQFKPFEGCSSNITDLKLRSHDTITTPNYPKNYPGDTECEWNLESDEGTVIEATFFDFVTQPWAWMHFDYVMVSDTGDWDDYYYRFSGDLNKFMPYTIVSKSNRMSIRFASSYLINFRGFKLSYVVRPENYNSTQAVGEGLSAVCDHEPMEIPKPVGETRPSMPEDGLWSSSAVQKERGNSAQKIAATSEVTPHQYPFVVALLVDELYFCGGSIVDNQHVLTAAHCTDGAEQVQVFMGSHDLTMEESSRQHQVVNFSQILPHPDYDPLTGANDIAVIRLNDRIEFNPYIQPVYLPTAESMANTFEDYNLTTIGWGEWTTRSKPPRISATLRKTASTVLPNRICRDSFKDLVNGNILCTVGSRADSPCNGDSGSPLVAEFNPNPTNVTSNSDTCYFSDLIHGEWTGRPWYIQLGVLSFGTRSCGSSSPIAHTRLTAYLDFITLATSLE